MNFGEAEKAKINGFNARCLAQITGEDRRKMAENPPYNLTTGIQRTRLIWLGHVLRMPENHPTRQGLLVYLSTLTTNNYPAGSIMENAPTHKNAAALIQFAVGDGSEKGKIEAKKKWKSHVYETFDDSLTPSRRSTDAGPSVFVIK